MVETNEVQQHRLYPYCRIEIKWSMLVDSTIVNTSCKAHKCKYELPVSIANCL